MGFTHTYMCTRDSFFLNSEYSMVRWRYEIPQYIGLKNRSKDNGEL